MNEVTNLKKLIKEAQTDIKADIKIMPLSGNDSFHLHLAHFNAQQKIQSHYHNHGEEIYLILEGTGLMKIGNPDTQKWESTFEVKTGDYITVAEKKVHQLINTHNSEALMVQFGCPLSHLNDDRFFIDMI